MRSYFFVAKQAADRRRVTHVGHESQLRRGAFMLLAAAGLVGMIGFVALSVDLGVISLTKTNLQKTADAAALAAAQEIIASVESASNDATSPGGPDDINSISISASKAMAEKVAEMNGVYIDPDRDVAFGRRVFNEDTQTFEIVWGEPPYTSGASFNVVQVTCRRDNPDTTKPDSVLELFFAPVNGTKSAAISASAIAFVEARDIVSILDFSGSMNYDSALRSIDTFGRTALEDNMEDIFDALQPVDLGDLEFTPEWLTVEGEDPDSEGEAKIYVTFKHKEVFIDSTKDIQEVYLIFEDGGWQHFGSCGCSSGTWKGSGNNNNEPIHAVYVRSGSSVTTVSGQPASGRNIPHIEVTFYEDHIDVESTKNLSNVVLEFSDGVHQKFEGLNGKTGSFQGTGSNTGKTIERAWIKSGRNHSGDGPGYGEEFENPGGSADPQYFEDNNWNVQVCFGLDNTPYPYPSGSWNDYIDHVRWSSPIENADYRKKYGGVTFVDYLLEKRQRNHQTPDLWKTPHYPFHAMKNGMSLFLGFLDELEFGDHVGLVTYDSSARIEKKVKNENNVTVADLGNDWISDNYTAVDTIQRRKQAGHYDIYTGLGYGIETGIELLDEHARPGSRPTLLVMTDGNANRSPSGWSLPRNWDWDELTDYDGDGRANYTSNDRHKQYAFYQAKQAIDKGYTVHTLSVGAGADRDLMRAIAFAGHGEWINVPGGTTIAEIEEQMLDAFARIAANVPPAKLLHKGN